MSMTPESEQYFNQHAEEWDAIRAGYFTEEVRNTAIAKAYLRPEMVVADVGAGTGFVAAGLAPLVREVHIFDGSAAMLNVARKNLQGFDNVVFHEGESSTLPMPAGSMDAVFANMYLHHCPDPLQAIQEMARLLKPGGRLVITDMDSHQNEWMLAEMADLWMGFERLQIKTWLQDAGLVNVIVDGSGQRCCANPESKTGAGDQAPIEISIFVAAGTRRVTGMQAAAQAGYNALAEGSAGSGCCQPAAAEDSGCCGGGAAQSSGSSCCSSAPSEAASSCCSGSKSEPVSDIRLTYTSSDMAAAPEEAANFSLGCGNPVGIASLIAGQTVLDIGSGGGLDSFLAAGQVGPGGRVIGVDASPAMLARARRSAEKNGYSQVEFRQGIAEKLPVENDTVDVVLSNCVINLTEDKGRAFSEVYRVLKPGGRMSISDIVASSSFSVEMKKNAALWSECITGALPEQEYLDLVRQAGFKSIRAYRSQSAGDVEGVQVYSLIVTAEK